MAANKQFIVMAIVIALLCTIAAALDDEAPKNVNILHELSGRFLQFRLRSQYGVLYMPPPNNPSSVEYHPESPPITFSNENMSPVVYPNLAANNLPDQFEHNYAAAIPDFRGKVYGTAMQRPGISTIHTEDLLLNLVLERMLAWYRAYHGQDPPAVYLYTYYIPCPDCTTIILSAMTNSMTDTNGNTIPLHVGFSQLMGGVQNEDVKAARNRLNNLRNTLNNNNGSVLDIGRLSSTGSGAVCSQQGYSSRSKRETQDTGVCTDNEILFLRMDFTTGKAQVQWYQPDVAKNSHAWFGLFDKKGVRRTWEYLSKEISGIKTFNAYMSDGFEVRLSDKYSANR